MLDYAANAVVYWPVEQLRAEFEQSCAANGTNPEEEIRDRLALEGDAELLWQRVKTNLQAGRSASSKSAQGSVCSGSNPPSLWTWTHNLAAIAISHADVRSTD